MRRFVRRRLTLLLVLAGLASTTPAFAQGSASATLTSTTCPGTGCVQLTAIGYGSVIVQIQDPQAGTWAAIAEVSNDSTGVFKPLSGTSTDGATTGSAWSSSTAFIVPGGALAVRVRLTSYSSGAPLVTLRGGPSSPPASVSATVSASNPAAGATGAGVPSQASYTGINIGGLNTGVTGFSVGTARAVATAIVDGSGNQITSFGGGTQYATGSAQATPTGTVALVWDGTTVRAASSDGSGNTKVVFASTPTVNSAQSGNWTARMVGNAGAIFDFAGQNASSPANSLLMGGQFNTTPTTITSGNSSPLQLDANGNLLVNIKAGSSSGTQYASGATVATPTGTVAIGKYNSTQPTITSGNVQELQLAARGELLVTTGADGFNANITGATGNTANVTAASTAAVASDHGVVVALSPNSPLQGMKDSGGMDMTDTSLHAVKVAIQNGSNTVTDAATQTAGASSVATVDNYQFAYNGSTYGRVFLDPCQDANATRTYTPISLTASGQVLAGTSAKKVYVCHLDLVSATAQNIALVEGTGTVCATGIVGMAGGTTAATGWNFGANGGVALGNGAASVAVTATAADNVCLLLSSTGQTSGVLVTAVR